MKTCPYCKQMIDDTHSFCINCMKIPDTKDVQKSQDYILEIERLKHLGLITEADFEKIITHYNEEIAKIVSPDITEIIKSCNILCKSNNYFQALKLCKEALKKEPDNIKALTFCSYIYICIGNRDEALLMYNKAYALDPNNIGLQDWYKRNEKHFKDPLETLEPEIITDSEKTLTSEKQSKAVFVEKNPKEKVEAKIKEQPPKPTWIEHFSSFLEEKNIKWIHTIGAIILLAGIIGLVKWQWALLGKYVIFAMLISITIGCSWVGNLTLKNLKFTGIVLLFVSALLIPVDFWAFYKFNIIGLQIDPNIWGLITTLSCTGIYIKTAKRLRTTLFIYLPIISLLSVIYFILAITNISTQFYCVFFTLMGFIYLITAYIINKPENKDISIPLYKTAHTIIAASLGYAFFYGRFFITTGIDKMLIMLITATITYSASAYMFEKKEQGYISTSLFVFFACLTLYRLDFREIQDYELMLSFVSIFFLLCGLLNRHLIKMEGMAEGYLTSGIILTFIIIISNLTNTFTFNNILPSKPDELLSNFLTSLIAAIIYATASFLYKKKGFVYLSISVLTYSILMLMSFYNVEPAFYPVILMVYSTTLIIGGFLTKEKDLYSPPLFNTGYTLSAISGIFSVLLYIISGDKYLYTQETAIFVLFMASLIYAYTAKTFKDPKFLYLSIVSAIGSYIFIALLLINKGLITFEPNWGILFVPFNLILGYILFTLNKKGLKEYVTPIAVFQNLITLFSICVQIKYLFWVVTPFKYTASFTLLFYSVFIPIIFNIEKGINSLKKFFIFISSASFTVGIIYLFICIGGNYGQGGVTLMAISFIRSIFLLKLENTEKQENWVLQSKYSLLYEPILAIYLSSFETNEFLYPIIACVFSALFYTITAYSKKRGNLVYLSSFFNISIFIYLLNYFSPNSETFYWQIFSFAALFSSVCYGIASFSLNSKAISYVSSVFFIIASLLGMQIFKFEGLNIAVFYSSGLIVTALILMTAGYLLKKKQLPDIAEGPYNFGYILSFISSIIAILPLLSNGLDFYNTFIPERNHIISIMTCFALINALFSGIEKNKVFTYISALSGFLGFIMSVFYMPALPGFEKNIGGYIIFYIGFLLIVSDHLYKKGAGYYGRALIHSAFAFSLFAIIMQPEYLKWNTRYTAIITLFAYSIIYAIASIKLFIVQNDKYKGTIAVLTYLSTATFTYGFIRWMHEISYLSINNSTGIIFTILVGIIWLLSAKLLQNKGYSIWYKPLFISSIIISILAYITIITNLEFAKIATGISAIILLILFYNIVVLFEKRTGWAYFSTVLLGIYYLILWGEQIAFTTPSYLFYFPLLISTAANLYTGYLLKSNTPVNISIITAICGYFIYIFDYSIKLPPFEKTTLNIMFCMAFIMLSIGYGKITIYLKSKVFGYYSAITATLAFLSLLMLLTDNWHIYGILFVIFNIILVSTGIYLKKFYDEKLFTNPFYDISFSIACLSIFYPFCLTEIGYCNIQNYAIITSGLYSVFFGAQAIINRNAVFTYISTMLFSSGFIYYLHRYQGVENLPVCGLLLACLCVFWFLAHLISSKIKDNIFEKPMFFNCITISIFAIICALGGAGLGQENVEYSVFTLLIIGSVYAIFSYIKSKSIFAHLAFFTLLFAYYLPCFDRNIKAMDFYLIPLGIYLLGLGFISRRFKEGINANPYYLIGLLVIFISSLISSISYGGVHSTVLMAESIFALLTGIYQKNKIFLFLGTIFLIINVFMQTFYLLAQIHWAIYATLTGIFLITAGIFFEMKREKLIKWTEQQIEGLKKWN